MPTPSIVRWDDASAPQLTTVASSLIAVLDFALLNHGWTKEFSATNIAVYRAPLGNRKYYRVLDDNSAVYNGLYSATVTAYDTMTDASTGSGWGAVSYIRKAYSTGNKRWIVLVDDYGFMLITQPAGTIDTDVNTYPMMPHYLGDDIPALPGTTSRAVLCCAKDNSSTAYGGGTGICVPTEAAVPDARAASFAQRDIAGNLSMTCYVTSFRYHSNDSNVIHPAGNNSNCPYTYPYNGELLYCRPVLTDTATVHTIGSFIPWLYHPMQKGSGLNSLETYTDGGKNLMALKVCGVSTYGYNANGTTTGYGAVLICTNESR